jgi:hypothetical protein
MLLIDTSPPPLAPAERFYRTPDRSLAAVLHTLGFSLIDVTRQAPGALVFVFRWTEDLDGAVASYWTDQLAVNARTLIQSLDEVQRMADVWTRGGDGADVV